MPKQKEEEKVKVKVKVKEEEKGRIIAKEDQMEEVRDEEIEPADELISQTMPVLYQAIVGNNIEAVRSCLDPYETAMRELYTDKEFYTSDVHNIYNTRIGNVEGMEIDDAHTEITPIQLTDSLGHHDICQIFISYGDDRRECTGETTAEDGLLD